MKTWRTQSTGLRQLVLALLVCVASDTAQAQEFVINNPLAADRFATLPADANFPEGIAANPATGDLFVGTFDVPPDGTGTNFILRFDRRGQVRAKLPLGPVPVTGLAFNPIDEKVYFARPAALFGLPSMVQRVPMDFDATTPVEDVVAITEVGAPPPRTEVTLDGQQIVTMFPDSVPAPNGLAFGRFRGESILAVTDSLQGALYIFQNPELAGPDCEQTTGCPQLIELMQVTEFASAAFPQLGINGVAILEGPEGELPQIFVTNTGDDRLLRLTADPTNPVVVVADSLEGADGIVPGPGNTLIVSMALGDELAVIDAGTGRILAELGEFRGIRRDGSPRGLLFPGSIVRVGNSIFANNLALPLSGNASEPELDVTTFTISRVRLPVRLPRLKAAP